MINHLVKRIILKKLCAERPDDLSSIPNWLGKDRTKVWHTHTHHTHHITHVHTSHTHTYHTHTHITHTYITSYIHHNIHTHHIIHSYHTYTTHTYHIHITHTLLTHSHIHYTLTHLSHTHNNYFFKRENICHHSEILPWVHELQEKCTVVRKVTRPQRTLLRTKEKMRAQSQGKL